MIIIHLDNGEKEQLVKEDLVYPSFIEHIRDYLQTNATITIRIGGGVKHINAQHILMIEVSDGC